MPESSELRMSRLDQLPIGKSGWDWLKTVDGVEEEGSELILDERRVIDDGNGGEKEVLN